MAAEGKRAPKAFLPALFGVRGYACVFVFIAHHYSVFGHQWLRPGSAVDRFFDGVHGLASMGIELFFGLSGFLIYSPLVRRKKVDMGKFYVRRLKRIYPAFLGVFAAYLVLSFIFPAVSKLPDGFGPSVVYILQNLALMPGMFRIEPIITVSWTLSHEAAFYIVAPILVLGLRLNRRRPTTRLLMAALVVAAAIPLWTHISRHRFCLMFLLGIMLADAEDLMPNLLRRSSFQWAVLAAFTLSALTLATGVAWEYARFYPLLIGVPSILLVACGTKNAAGPVTRGLCWKPAVWMGPISYSFYLVHGLALNGLKLGLIQGLGLTGESTLLFFLVCPVAFGLAIAAATVLYKYVEEPFSMRRGKTMAPAPSPERAREPVSA